MIDEVIVACPRSMLDQILPVVSVCAQIGVPVTLSSTVSLCAALGGIRPELINARAVNGLAEVTYGKDDGAGGVSDERTISNRCSDDLSTEDVIEPSGIKLTAADLEAIDAACTP